MVVTGSSKGAIGWKKGPAMPKPASQNPSSIPSNGPGDSASLFGDEDHLMADLNRPAHTAFGKVSQHYLNPPQTLSARLGSV